MGMATRQVTNKHKVAFQAEPGTKPRRARMTNGNVSANGNANGNVAQKLNGSGAAQTAADKLHPASSQTRAITQQLVEKRGKSPGLAGSAIRLWRPISAVQHRAALREVYIVPF